MDEINKQNVAHKQKIISIIRNLHASNRTN